MAIKIKVLNRLRMLRKPIAAEIESSRSDCRAWICILMYQKYRLGEPTPHDAPWIYQVVRFEAEKQYLEDPACEEVVYYDELGVHHYETLEFLTEEEALKEVEKWLDDLDKLDAPWNCDYPI